MSSKVIQKNSFKKIDITGVYAYADPAHLRDRELWRGFLGSVLPVVLPQLSENIDYFISEALSDSIDDLIFVEDFDTEDKHAMRKISAHVAESIGVPLEFALASFYESDNDINLPTKLHKFHYIPVKKHIKVHQEESMIAVWLSRFHQVCNEKKFLVYIEMWKDWLT